MKNTWTTPKLKSYPLDSNKEWYVWFRFNGGNPIRIKQGLNKIADYTERMQEGEALAMVLEDKLKKGWIPESNRKKLPQPYNTHLSVESAYKMAYDLMLSSKLTQKTKETYKCHYNYFISAVKKRKWNKSLFIEMERFHFENIIEDIVKDRGLGNAFFNKHSIICKAYCKILKDKYIIKENKALGILERKHRTAEKKLLTPEEQTLIYDHFQKHLPAYNTYLKVLYHLSIRPKELRLLKCEMIKRIDKNGKSILYFDLPYSITKNKNSNKILMPADVADDLKKFDLSNGDFYLFGKYFIPDIKSQAVNRANKLWKDEVKDKLGINSDMYFLKSKGNNDKMRNGMSKEALKAINRHSTVEITEIYATEHEIILMEQNIDKFGTFQ